MKAMNSTPRTVGLVQTMTASYQQRKYPPKVQRLASGASSTGGTIY